MLPEDAIQLTQRWAEDRTPVEFRDRIKVEVETHPRGLSIVECSLMPNVDRETGWLCVPRARLGYSSGTGDWTLYWFDRNSKVRRYPDFETSKAIQDLLDEIENDSWCIFWG